MLRTRYGTPSGRLFLWPANGNPYWAITESVGAASHYLTGFQKIPFSCLGSGIAVRSAPPF